MGTRIVLIGAGSAQFGLGTLDDILHSQVLSGATVVLHDINLQSLDRVYRLARDFVEERSLPFEIAATTSREEALQGANFAIISIEVGNRFQLWEQDWRVPQQFGIRQIYGENGGPGGLFHALRIIPPILEICADIERLCPEAHVFNFSNPMSRICTTVTRRFPDLKFVGLCHEIASLPRHLPKILNTPFENLIVRAGGLNHFSVLLEVRYRDTGRDAYPELRAKAPAYFGQMPRVRRAAAYQGGPQVLSGNTWPERGLFQVILEDWGYLPITTDSHFGEYIQWAWDVVDHEGILDFYEWYKGYCQSVPQRIEGASNHERVIPIIEGILTNSGQEELAVNVPNKGLIENLPSEIVVEVPATVDAQGVSGITLGALPRPFAGLLRNQVAVHDLTAEAVLTRSKKAALQALLVDPVVHSYQAAKRTLETILDLQSDYLGYLT